MQQFTITRTLFDFPLTAQVSVLDDGLHVLLTGGCLTHVGAVTTVYRRNIQTLSFPGHKDQIISEMWAKELAGFLMERSPSQPCPEPGAAVTVACGIHYDGVDKEKIQAIVSACEEILREAEEKIR